jgi:hypothetical protein
MKISGTISKIAKTSNLVLDTPSNSIDRSIDRYTRYITLSGTICYYKDARLTDNTNIGDKFEAIVNKKYEILAWKNLSTNKKSIYTWFHIIFHANNIVAFGVYLIFWYATKTNSELNYKVNLIAIPIFVIVFIISSYFGLKKLKAQKQITLV